MAPLKVTIIGGGLAGACLANGLINKSNNQIDVSVFERDEAGSERGGYQIRLGAYALAGFRACLTKEQFASLLPLFGKSGGVVSSAPCIFSPSDLKVLVDLSKAPYMKRAPRLREMKNSYGNVTDDQVKQQLAVYEKSMIPRAFDWVKKSTNQQLPDLDSVTGKAIMLGLRVVLFVLGIGVKCLGLFGWQPKDEAPELS
ncbi:hypothetical protein NXS19_004496 [Fusarium pseudograminearum]|nr:hypothetical protein NXS19_004496 [Fusarium pseudograminearum]